jgi:hypothetical protein
MGGGGLIVLVVDIERVTLTNCTDCERQELALIFRENDLMRTIN